MPRGSILGGFLDHFSGRSAKTKKCVWTAQACADCISSLCWSPGYLSLGTSAKVPKPVYLSQGIPLDCPESLGRNSGRGGVPEKAVDGGWGGFLLRGWTYVAARAGWTSGWTSRRKDFFISNRAVSLSLPLVRSRRTPCAWAESRCHRSVSSSVPSDCPKARTGRRSVARRR